MYYYVEDLNNLKSIKYDIENEQENSGLIFNTIQDLKDYFEYTGCKTYLAPAGYNSYLDKHISAIWDNSSITDILLGYVIEV